MPEIEHYQEQLLGLWKVVHISFDYFYQVETDTNEPGLSSLDGHTCDWSVQFDSAGKLKWTFSSTCDEDHKVLKEVLQFFEDLKFYDLDCQLDDVLQTGKQFEMYFQSLSGINVPAVLTWSKSSDIRIKFQFAEIHLEKVSSGSVNRSAHNDHEFSLTVLLNDKMDCDMIICDDNGGHHPCHSSLMKQLTDDATATWLQGKSSDLIDQVLHYFYSGTISPQLNLVVGSRIQKRLKSEKRMLSHFKMDLSKYLLTIGKKQKLLDNIDLVKKSLVTCISLVSDSHLITSPSQIPQVLHTCINHILVGLVRAILCVHLYEQLSSKDRKTTFPLLISGDFYQLIKQLTHALTKLSNSVPTSYHTEFGQICSEKLSVLGKIVSLSLDKLPNLLKSHGKKFLKDTANGGSKSLLSKHKLSLFKDIGKMRKLEDELVNPMLVRRDKFRRYMSSVDSQPDGYKSIFMLVKQHLEEMDEGLSSDRYDELAEKLQNMSVKRNKIGKTEKKTKSYCRIVHFCVLFLQSLNQEQQMISYWNECCSLLQNEEFNKVLIALGFVVGKSAVVSSGDSGENVTSSAANIEDNSVRKVCSKLWTQLQNDECSWKADLKITVAGHREFNVHSLIVAARCPWISRLLQSGMTEALQRHLRLPEVSHEVIQCVLSFIYTGSLPAQLELNAVLLVELIQASDQYELEHLTRMCADALLPHIDEHSAVSLHELGVQTNQIVLSNAAFRFMKHNVNSLTAEELSLLSSDLRTKLLEHKEDTNNEGSTSSSLSEEEAPPASLPYDDMAALLETFRSIVGNEPSDEILSDILVQADGDLNRAVNFYLA